MLGVNRNIEALWIFSLEKESCPTIIDIIEQEAEYV